MPTITTIVTSSPAETNQIGEGIGHAATADMIVILDGDLGTGKTVLAHGMARGLRVDGWRGSPTFNLIHEYAGRLPFFHLDAYRITATELIDLDFQRLMEARGVIAVEWGGKTLETVKQFSPSRLIHIRLKTISESSRRIEIEE